MKKVTRRALRGHFHSPVVPAGHGNLRRIRNSDARNEKRILRSFLPQDDTSLSSTRTVDGAASARSTSRNRRVLESYVAVSIEPPAAVAEGGLGANPKSVTVSSPAANSTLARTAPSSETSLMRLRPSDANSPASPRNAMLDGPSGAAMK